MNQYPHPQVKLSVAQAVLDPIPKQSINPSRRLTLVMGLLLIATVFYVYAYNSGYGYDACDYLLVGRSLLDGFRISSFILSKGWATYVMSAMVLAVFPASNHAWIAFVITLLFAFAVVGTWWVGRNLFGEQVAILSALLVAACAFFMELNFLEPEIPVYLCGLLAVHFLAGSGWGRPALRFALAGACLGLGFAFKAVALFYLVAIFGFLFLNRKRAAIESLRSMIWIVLGCVTAIAIPACYFAATGQLRHQIEWSFLFPLFHFPANTFWLRKLYTKLLWFFLALGGAALLAVSRPFRHAIFANPSVSLVLWMGGVSLLSLLKTQSSHYVFPGAAFLSFFIAQTLWSWWSKAGPQKIPVWLPLAAIVVMVMSAFLYSPAVFSRFVRKRDFDEETRIGARLRTLARPEDRVLFLHGGMPLYLLADRYPNVPFFHTDVQTTYILFQEPRLLTAALDDRRLKLVEFDPDHLDFDDPRFLDTEHHRRLIREFSQILQERFSRVQDLGFPPNLWVRRADHR